MTRALLLALILLLAACGSPTTPTPPAPTPTPPTAPVTPPVTPTPPVPDVPGQGVTYYGEWGWTFQGNETYQSREGRFSMLDVLGPNDTDTNIGLYQDCYGPCIDRPDGYAVLGPDADGKLVVTLFRLSSTDDLVPLYKATDSDGELSKDDRGRLVFEGRGTAYEEFSDVTKGDFTAVFIADKPALAFAE